MYAKGKNALGRRGEDMACAYLESIGHEILERNWKSGRLEIDIITSFRDGVHFVEVKSAASPGSFDPAEKVDERKRRRITSAALRYLNAHAGGARGEVSFDVVSVVFEGGESRISYVPGAWIPIYL